MEETYKQAISMMCAQIMRYKSIILVVLGKLLNKEYMMVKYIKERNIDYMEKQKRIMRWDKTCATLLVRSSEYNLV